MATRKRAARKTEQPITATAEIESQAPQAVEATVSEKVNTEPANATPSGTTGFVPELVSAQAVPDRQATTPRKESWAEAVRPEESRRGATADTPVEARETRQEQQQAAWTPPPVRVVKTVDLDGYKITLQQKPKRFDEKTQKMYPRQMQIKFGDGSARARPSDEVIDTIKSYKVSVDTPDGLKERQMFHFDGEERAWGISLSYKDNDETSKAARVQAEKVFDQVVKMVAQEIGAGQTR